MHAALGQMSIHATYYLRLHGHSLGAQATAFTVRQAAGAGLRQRLLKSFSSRLKGTASLPLAAASHADDKVQAVRPSRTGWAGSAAG